MNIQRYLKKCQNQTNDVLSKLIPVGKQPRQLHQAIAYSLEGGKRLRAALVYATGAAVGANKDILDMIAAVIEMIHAYTLIHDDLPALDNDDLRRGKPTCHKVFSESTAILAGDALQTLAFTILSSANKNLAPQVQLKMIHLLGLAIGSLGVIGGEELDLKMINRRVTTKKLENMYALKTGALIKASIQLSVLASNCQSKKILSHLDKFSEYIGIAFQIHDDIIGIESNTKTLGKKQGADLAMNKPVYPVLVGLNRAKKRKQFLYLKALTHLDKTGLDMWLLKEIATYLITRNY